MANRIKGITVEIGGDTTGLDKALRSVNSTISSTQSALKDVNHLLKLDPSNTELLSQKQKLLKESIQGTKEKLDALKQAQMQAKQQLENGDLGQDKYDALQREITETEQKLKSLEEQFNNTSSTAAKMEEAAENIGSFGDACTNAGKKMLPVSTGIAATGVASAKMAMDFEDAMAKVSTIADTTEVPLSDLEGAIVELSNQTGISSSEIAQNVYDAISAGQSTSDAVNFVTNSTKLAKAGFAEAGDALNILTTIMNAYGLEASEVNNVSDMLVQTQNLGKTTVAELSSTMGKIIPTANAYGVELDQLCAGYALMTSNGVATAESTTYMNSMLNELGKSGTTVSETLKSKTGSSFAELMEKGYSLSDCLAIINDAAMEQGLSFSDMFSSSEAAKAGLILLSDSADDFNTTLSEMQNSTGATDTAFEKLQTNSYSIQVTFNQLKNTLITLGQTIMSLLAPAIESLSEKIQSFSKWFSGLSNGSKQMIVTIAAIVAAIGPVLIIIGKMSTGISAVIKIITTLIPLFSILGGAITSISWPVLAIAAAIAALIAIGVLLYKNWDTIKAKALAIFQVVADWISQKITAIKSFFSGLWTHLTIIWDTIFNVVQTAIMLLGSILQAAFEIITLPYRLIWENCKEIVMTIWEGIKSIVSSAIETISTAISTVMSTISLIISTIWNAIYTTISTVLNTIQAVISSVSNAIKSVASTVWNGIGSVITLVVDGIRSKVSSVFESVKSTVSSVFNGIKSVATNVWNGIKSAIITPIEAAKAKVKSVVDAIKGFFSGLKLNLPNIKLPHFKVTGKLSIAPPSVPKLSIEWYKDGGIMSSPTIFGLNGSSLMAGGEAGKEAILPLKGFYDQLESILSNRLNTSTMEQYLSIIAANSGKGIYLDDGTLVGSLLPAIDSGLANYGIRSRRGNR